MAEFLAGLSRSIEGAPSLALGAAFLWGMLSVVLSPCHLSSIPLIVGFVAGQGGGPKRALAASSLFAAGVLVTMAALGAVTTLAGRVTGDIGPYGNYVVAAVLFAVGLYLLEVVPAQWSISMQARTGRKGLVSGFVLGLLFGVCLGPCAFAYMAPMLGITFRLAARSPTYGAMLLLAYGVGHSLVIAAAGTSTGLVQRYLNWSEESGGLVALKKTCGALLLLGGVYLVYTAH